MNKFQIKSVKGAAARSRPATGFDSDDSDTPEAQQPSGDQQQSAAELQEAGDRAAAAGQWGAAIQRWDAALSTGPAEPHKLHEAKAQVWLQVGEDWKAVCCAQRAVELCPGWPEAHLTLSRAQFNLGEPELALASMETVLRLQPGHPEAAEEVAAMRAVVLQRQQGGGSGGAGQRARVVPGPGGGPP